MIVNHVLHPITSLLSAFGNGLVIISVAKFDWIRTQTNLYVVLLAICDFIMGIPIYCATLTTSLIVENHPNAALAYRISCQTTGVLIAFASFGDLLCILAITIERFLYIHLPLRYEIIHTMTRAKCVSIICVLISLTYAFTGILTNPFNPRLFCVQSNVINNLFLDYIHFPLFGISSIIILVFFGKTARIIYKTRKQIATVNSNDNPTVSQMKITKVMSLVIGVFVVTYIVYVIGVHETTNMTGSSRL